MTAPRLAPQLTLAVYANAKGLGWVLCAGPLYLVEHGLYAAPSREKNAACLARFAKILDRLQPAELVLEAFDKEQSVRSDRIRTLCLRMVDVAAARGIAFTVYSRADAARTFDGAGAKTRDEIAEAVARHFPALSHRLPRPRKAWEGEDRRLALFNAGALALTRYHNGATALLDEKRNAA